MREELKPVEFAVIEQRFEPLSPASEAMLTRFFRVKIQSLHFCGRAFYDRSLIEGFRNLALMYPVILWLGRWLAAGQQRKNLAEADVARAMSMVRFPLQLLAVSGSAGPPPRPARRHCPAVRLVRRVNDCRERPDWIGGRDRSAGPNA